MRGTGNPRLLRQKASLFLSEAQRDSAERKRPLGRKSQPGPSAWRAPDFSSRLQAWASPGHRTCPECAAHFSYFTTDPRGGGTSPACWEGLRKPGCGRCSGRMSFRTMNLCGRAGQPKSPRFRALVLAGSSYRAPSEVLNSSEP